MKLALSILSCVLLGFTTAKRPPPSYNNYDESNYSRGNSDSSGGPGSSDGFGFEGFAQPSQSSDGGFDEGGGENEISGQSDDFGYGTSPHNPFQGSTNQGAMTHSYSPPSFDSFGPPMGQGKKKRYGFMGLGFLPKIRINIKRRPSSSKGHHASPSIFSYPTYASGSGAHSSPFSSSGPSDSGSSDFFYPEAYSGGSGGSSGPESSSGSGGPSKSHSSYDSSGPPSKGHGHSSYGSNSNSYGTSSKRPYSSYNSPPHLPSKDYGSSNQYGSGSGSQSGGLYSGSPSIAPSSQYGNQYGSRPSSYGGYKPSSQSSPPKDYGYSSSNNIKEPPQSHESGPGYVRGPSYTKYGPPMKGHSQSSPPVSMGGHMSYGDDASSQYNSPSSEYGGGPSKGKEYSPQMDSGPSGYNDYDEDNENRSKRRPSQSSYGSPPRKVPPPHRGKMHPSPPHSSGGFRPSHNPYSNSGSGYNSHDSNQGYQSSMVPEFTALPDAPPPGPYAAEDLAGY